MGSTARQQREAANLLERAVGGHNATRAESVTESVTEGRDGVAANGVEGPLEGDPLENSGSGGRTRTYDQAVNSRPLYH